jgi:hypothetical protein
MTDTNTTHQAAAAALLAMTPDEHVALRISTLEALTIATAALSEIHKGSSVRGRWIINGSTEAADDENDNGHNPDQAPAGYYDSEEADPNLPEDDRDAATFNPDDAPEIPDDLACDESELILHEGEWLQPVTWEEYSPDDQAEWLRSIAGISRFAMERIEKLLPTVAPAAST